MSAPVRDRDDNAPPIDEPSRDESLNAKPRRDGPLKYAPKMPRRSVHDQDRIEPPNGVDGSPPLGTTEPPWRRKERPGAFAGDVAMVELRDQLARVSDWIPEPPSPRSTSAFGAVGPLTGVILAAAAGAYGYVWGFEYFWRFAPPQLIALVTNHTKMTSTDRSTATGTLNASHFDANPPVARPATSGLASASTIDHASDASDLVTSVRPTPPPAAARPEPRTTSSSLAAPVPAQPAAELPEVDLPTPAPPANAQSDLALPRAAPMRLAVDALRSRPRDQPARLLIVAANVGPNVSVTIDGLAPGSALSTGTPAGPNTWQLSTEDLQDAMVAPPSGFVGVMDLSLELRLANGTVVDRKNLQLEWSGASPATPAKTLPRRLAAAEAALMLRSGAEFMANGNIAAARMLFQPAAESGEAAAAFALAETYDPLVLKKLGAKGGITPDAALALNWYEKARTLGSTLATERLKRLALLPE